MLMDLEAIESRRMFAATLPAGFSESIVVAQGLNQPTSLARLPDGRLLVSQKSGGLRLIQNSGLSGTPVVALAVNSTSERGLLSVVADPNFSTNHYIYVNYFPQDQAFARISRFEMEGATVEPGSEHVLLQIDPQTHSTAHAGGAMHFGTDGMLYIAVGDNQFGANAQSFDTLQGKLLRINPDGSIPASNPFYDTLAGDLRAIYSIGLRNPYTFGVDSVGGSIYINDVGEKSYEEIDLARAGANFGWPDSEGPTDNPAFDTPIFSYSPREPGLGESIVGGAFYTGVTQQFPSQYAGKYFFGDYVQGTIRTLDPTTHTASPFAEGLGKIIDLDVLADGTLLCTTYDGVVHAIRYSPQPPPSTGALRGFTFNDSNRSGTFDSADNVASGKTVFLDINNNNQLDAGEVRVVTDASGNFAFNNLAAGSYHVRRVFPSGYGPSTAAIDVNLLSGQVVTGLSIGSVTTNVPPPPPPPPPPGSASFTGYVVNDTNKDGKWSGGEKGIAGRTVWSDLDNDGVLDANEVRQVTDSNGKFTFTGLAAGTYKFREVVPTGWKQTSPANGFGLAITLTAGQVKSGSSFQVAKV